MDGAPNLKASRSQSSLGLVQTKANRRPDHSVSGVRSSELQFLFCQRGRRELPNRIEFGGQAPNQHTPSKSAPPVGRKARLPEGKWVTPSHRSKASSTATHRPISRTFVRKASLSVCRRVAGVWCVGRCSPRDGRTGSSRDANGPGSFGSSVRMHGRLPASQIWSRTAAEERRSDSQPFCCSLTRSTTRAGSNPGFGWSM